VALGLAFVSLSALFLLWPEIDLAVSRPFYVPGQGFPLAEAAWAEALRWLIWRMSEGVVALSLLLLGLAAIRRSLGSLGAREGGFILLLYGLGPGLLVNGILKSYWGRARPASVTEFGGTLDFTPPLLIADECTRNCSFVSGEGAAAVALCISLIVILSRFRDRLSPFLFRALVSVAVFIALAGSLLRIAAGRHFLSDTLFAAVLVLAIAAALAPLLRSRRVPGMG
jgi:lipid A 4'-phosphatase